MQETTLDGSFFVDYNLVSDSNQAAVKPFRSCLPLDDGELSILFDVVETSIDINGDETIQASSIDIVSIDERYRDTLRFQMTL